MPSTPERTSFVARTQDRVARAFGVAPGARGTTIEVLLAQRGAAAGYWLQVVLATGIATLGLVLDSAAVVIGAMLIAPLMAPIVGLAMGLAVGSPFLVLRSFVRVVGSVALVIAGASGLTLLLPFHEVTREISSRTSPTVLDLGVAVLCALAGAYAMSRPASETAATAAGTSVSIALVPPLCVVGYGVGTASMPVAWGAGLLFLTNLCAIVVFAALAFLVLGYASVDVRALERKELAQRDRASLSVRAARRLARVFASPYAPVFRLLMPLLLLALVFVPLRRGLADVSWEVRVRSAIEQRINALPEVRVRSAITVQHHDVIVHLVMLGSGADADRLRRRLATEIQAVAGVEPTVDVVAVPDEHALHALAAELTRASPPPPAAPKLDLSDERAQLGSVLATVWPTSEAGPPAGWRLSFAASGAARIEVVHLGARLGPAGIALLGSALAAPLGARPDTIDVALPAEVTVADDRTQWLASARSALDSVRETTGLFVCLEAPHGDASDGGGDGGQPLLRDLPALDPSKVSLAQGARWSVRVSAESCGARDDAGPVDVDAAEAVDATAR